MSACTIMEGVVTSMNVSDSILNKRKDITGAFIRIFQKRKALQEAILSAYNIEIYPAQHRMLMFLAERPGLSQKDLANILQISQATVTISLKKLIKSGYVVKTSKENDNRCNVLTITDKGREVISKSIMVFDAIDNRVYEGLSEEDMDILLECLKKINANIKNFSDYITDAGCSAAVNNSNMTDNICMEEE